MEMNESCRTAQQGDSLPANPPPRSFDMTAKRLVQIMTLVEQMIDDPLPNDDDRHVVNDLLKACWECRRQLDKLAIQDSASQSDAYVEPCTSEQLESRQNELGVMVEQLEQLTRRHEYWLSGSRAAYASNVMPVAPDVEVAAVKVPPTVGIKAPPTVTRNEEAGPSCQYDYGGSFGKHNSSVHTFIKSLVGSFGGSFGGSATSRDAWPVGHSSASLSGSTFFNCCAKDDKNGVAVEELNTFEPICQLPSRESTTILFAGSPATEPTADLFSGSPVREPTSELPPQNLENPDHTFQEAACAEMAAAKWEAACAEIAAAQKTEGM